MSALEEEIKVKKPVASSIHSISVHITPPKKKEEKYTAIKVIAIYLQLLTLSYRDPFPGEEETIFLYTIIVKASTKIYLQFFLFKSVDKYYFPSRSWKTHTKMLRQQDCVIELGKW